MAVDGAGRRDQAVAHDRPGVRADAQLDAVAYRLVPGPPDADDPPVLDPDVGLDDAEDRIEDERAGDDRVQLRVRGAALGRPRSKGLGVAPDRFVARGLAVIVDADPQVGVAEPDLVAGRRAVACEPLGGGRGPSSVAHQRHGPDLAGGPALVRAGREVEAVPAGGGAVEGQARVGPLEGVVARHADDPGRGVADLELEPGTRCRLTVSAGSAGSARRVAPGASSPAGPSGSTRTTSRTPSSTRTSSRTSPTRAATPGSAWSAVTASRPACFHLLVRGPGPGRLQHRVADQRDDLRAFSSNPRSRCRRASSAAVKMRRRSSSQAVSRIAAS